MSLEPVPITVIPARWDEVWDLVARAERPDEVQAGILLALNAAYREAHLAVQEADEKRLLTKWSWRRVFF